MSISLIPEKNIQISPSLATTIGLEEATMLSVLAELLEHRGGSNTQGFQWLRLAEDCVQRFMPFWTEHDIQRISKNLADTGILLLSSAPYGQSRELHFAFNEQATSVPAAGAQASSLQTAPDLATPGELASSHRAGVQSSGVQTSGLQSSGLQSSAPPNRATRFETSPRQYSPAPRPPTMQTRRTGANRIAPNWQPGGELIKKIGQYNIPTEFVYEQLPEFVTYWSERDEPHHSWGSKFLKQVLRKWRERQSDFGRRDQEVAMFSGWHPSQDALDIMTRQAQVNPAFIDDAIPEFVLYWQERGDKSRAWNSKFIQHVRRQWARYNSALEHDTEPRRIAQSWQPNDDVFDVLKLANIDLNFARTLVPEFVLFWRDGNQVHTSWNTKFLQHTKYHWARRHELSMNNPQSLQAQHHAGQQNSHNTNRTRDRSLVDDLSDRSWAS